MNILYSGDKNIADGLIISLLSLMEHNKEPLNVFVLTMNYSDGESICEPLPKSFAQFLDKLLKKNNSDSSLTLIDVTPHFTKEVPSANMQTRFTVGCMLRLFADSALEIPDKILYLDNDVVCRGSIAELYSTDIDEYEFAGVLDYYGRWFFRKKLFAMDYINSGVLLLNMKRIRQTGLFINSRQRCREKKMFMPDQSALNKLANRKKILPRRYNEQRKLRKDTVLQHFTTSFRFFPVIHTVTCKPWQIEKMHSVLKLYCYDSLYERLLSVKEQYEAYLEKEIRK